LRTFSPLEKSIKNFLMALIPNNKKKKDGKLAANQKSNSPGFPAPKGKTNSKGIPKNTRLTGGSQRGS
jgi:hypothetical protein